MNSFTNKEVYEIYMSQNDSSKDGKVSSTVSALENRCAEGNVEWASCEKRFNKERKVKKLVDKHREIRNKSTVLKEWENSVFVDLKPLEEAMEVMDHDVETMGNKQGRPKKRLSENPGDKTSHKILDGILDYLASISAEQNVSTGALLRALTDRWVQRNGDESLEKSKPDMPVLSACSMIFNLNLSVNQYQELRLELLPYGFMLPVRNTVDVFKKTLLPQSVFSAPVKTSCDVMEVISQTVISLLDIHNLSPTGNLKVVAKFGLDGSGSHQIRHQVADGDSSGGSSSDEEEEEKETTSYLGGFWCPLHVTCGDVTLRNNPLPNSILHARPVCLVREKETRESVSEHFKPYMDKLAEIEMGLVPITSESSAQVVTELSMMDGKMLDIVQGDSGAFCHYCNATRADANNITKINNGSADKCLEIWESMESGEMSYSDKDRKGQVHKPLNIRNIRFYGITHQKLRSLDHMEKLLYHLVSGQTHTWSEGEYRVKDALKSAKKETIDRI